MSNSSWPFKQMSKDKYEKTMEARRERLREIAQDRLKAVVNRHGGDTLFDASVETGLCTSTISRYRSGKWGSRGPLYTTFLGFSGAAKK